MNENLKILKPFLRGFPIVVLSMIIAVMAAKKYLSYVTPMYESTAKLKLADINDGVPAGNLFKNFDVFASANKITAEIEVLKSTELLNKALKKTTFNTEIFRKGNVHETELFEDSPVIITHNFNNPKGFNVIYPLTIFSEKDFEVTIPQTSQKLKGSFGKELQTPYGLLLIDLNKALLQKRENIRLKDNYHFEFLSDEKLLDKIYKNLDIVSVDKDVPVIRINFKSNVPQKAAIFVNTLAETYIYDYIDSKYKAANTTVNFLNSQIKEASDKLAKSEDKIEDYRNKENIVNIRQETETDLRKISQLKIQQTNIKMNLEAIDELNRYIGSGKENFLSLAPNFEAFTDLLSTEMVKNIKRLQAEKKDLLLVYTPNDEKVKIIDEKIKDLTDYLVESIKNTKTNLQIKYDQLTKDINEAEKVFVTVPEKEKLLTIMTRDFDLLQSSYNFLNEKKIEAEIAQSAKIAFHRLISPGTVSGKPISPIRSIIIIVSAIMALIGSTALIYIVHILKGKVNDIGTIEKNSSIPVVLLTPYLQNGIRSHFLKEAIQLELKKLILNNAVITISSCDKESEHLFHSIQLAEAYAQQGRKILVLDACGTFSSSHPNITTEELNDAIYCSYSQETMKLILTEKIQGYDLCIIHNQAMHSETVGLMLMSLASTNLFVLDSRKTAARKVSEIEILKDKFNLPNMNFILNKAGYNPNVALQVYKKVKQLIKNHRIS